MQGTGLARRKRINKFLILTFSLITMALLIVVDQVTKICFKNLYEESGRTTVIDGFFYFTYTVNTGAAWSFLAGKSWSQTFFKVLTVLAILIFIFIYYLAYKKSYKWLQFSVSLTLAGTIGNFIDRLLYDGVTDFISFVFGSYHFPVFNVADICLTIGVSMMVIHFLFLDENAVFKFKNKKDSPVKSEDNSTITDCENDEET